MSDRTDASAAKFRTGTNLFLILFITFFAFFPSLKNPFIIWDDPVHILENESVRSLSPQNIQDLFHSTVGGTYIPLTILSHAIEYHFVGYKPFLYHLDNLLLHLAVVGLIFWFARQIRLSVMASVIAALLFGIHPMHVESVAWMTERKDVLYAFFYLLSLNCYAQYVSSKKSTLYLLSVLFALFSILSKAMALSLPLIFLLYDWFSGRKWSVRLLLEKIPHALIIVPITWITYAANARWIATYPLKNFLTWVWCLLFYVRRFLFPDTFLALYQLPKPVSLTNPLFAASLIIVIVILGALVRQRHNRLAVFAFLYYFGSIFFLLRFDDMVDTNFVADRFMYLPSLGICLWLGYDLERASNRYPSGSMKKISAVLIGLILVGLFVKTYRQCELWGGERLWTNVIKHYPNDFRAYNQRGLMYQARGEIDPAQADFEKSIEVNPQYDLPYVNLGVIAEGKGELAEALAFYLKAVEVNPKYSESYFSCGNIYSQQGRFDTATDYYTRALKIEVQVNPRLYKSVVYASRGAAYFSNRQYHLAFDDFNQALELNPDNTVALDNRAIIYSSMGYTDPALADYNKSLLLKSDDPTSYYNRALFYYNQHQYDLSLADLERALRFDPSHVKALELKQEIEKVRGNSTDQH